MSVFRNIVTLGGALGVLFLGVSLPSPGRAQPRPGPGKDDEAKGREAGKEGRPAPREGKPADSGKPAEAREEPARPAPREAASTGGCTEDDVKKVAALNIKAMEKYDDYDFEGAKQTLEDALALAKRVGCERNLVTAKSYLYLGIVFVGGMKDYEAGKKTWFKAFRLFPAIKLPRRVATPRLMRNFTAARQAFKASGGAAAARPGARPGRPGAGKPRPGARPARPKGPPQGLEHSPVSEAAETEPMIVEARVASSLDPGRVVIFYRPAFATSYRKVEATKSGKWTWKAEIPGKDVRGKVMRYYIVVWSNEGKPVAASGNAASPHLATLKEPESDAPGGFEENPLTGRRVRVRPRPRETGEPELPGVTRKKGETKGGKVKKKAKTGPKAPALFLISAGTGMGFGLLNGHTEVARQHGNFEAHEQLPSGAISRGSVYAQLQIGYLMTPNFSIGVMGRIGKTFISTEVAEQGESNYIDWQIFGRIRYLSRPYDIGLDWAGLKWYAGGGVGYGFIRHHIKAKDVVLEEGGQTVTVTDTDRATGVMPNAFAGAQLAFLDGMLNVFLEANYMAAFASDPDDNLYFHMDFTLGVNTEF